MRAQTVARNYAEALLAVAERADALERFADLLDALAGAIEADETIRHVIDSPRVPKAKKAEILRRAMAPHAPEPFLRFLDAVVRRRRQSLLPQISEEYSRLVDVRFDRVHAGVTLAREPNEPLQNVIREQLSRILQKEVIPHFRVDAAILGGVVVRVGDRVMDGSIRRRLVKLRRQMLGV